MNELLRARTPICVVLLFGSLGIGPTAMTYAAARYSEFPPYIHGDRGAVAHDRAGFTAMQPLVPSDSPLHFMLPLPLGLPENAPELFGFYTYEFRVGHNFGWSTAQGRFGTALRVTGVQHPAPPLTCMVARSSRGIVASAPYANPVQEGPPGGSPIGGRRFSDVAVLPPGHRSVLLAA